MDTTFQDQLSVTFYPTIMKHSLSNSKPQVFRTILGNCGTPFPSGLCQDRRAKIYDNPYCGTGGVVEVGRISSF